VGKPFLDDEKCFAAYFMREALAFAAAICVKSRLPKKSGRENPAGRCVI
jgi:hypothetical protein